MGKELGLERDLDLLNLHLPIRSFKLEQVLEHVVTVLGSPLGVVVGPIPDVRIADHVCQVLEVLLVNVPPGPEVILK